MWQLRGGDVIQLSSFSRSAGDELLVVRPNELQLVGSAGNTLINVKANSIAENLQFYRAFQKDENIGVLCSKVGSNNGHVIVVDQDGQVIDGPNEVPSVPNKADLFISAKHSNDRQYSGGAPRHDDLLDLSRRAWWLVVVAAQGFQVRIPGQGYRRDGWCVQRRVHQRAARRGGRLYDRISFFIHPCICGYSNA